MLQMLQMIGSGSAAKLYADDVFSTYLYTGNGGTQTINNGIDLAGKGGSVWTKIRPTLGDHFIYDSVRGMVDGDNDQALIANKTDAQSSVYSGGITAISSTGYSIGNSGNFNANTHTYVSWTFRNAPKFHAHAVVTKSAGSNVAINFPELETLGMVRVKRTDAASSWYVWHRSLTAGKLLIGETTAAETPLGHITVSGTTVTLVNGVIADGAYLVEAFAHDASADGLIQCGSFTTDGSGNATVNLGWEPQYVMFKRSSAVGNWNIVDSMRGMPVGTDNRVLAANTSDAESIGPFCSPTATGFNFSGATGTYIYLAIRRPNKPPKTGAEVFAPVAYSDYNNSEVNTTVVADLVLVRPRQAASTTSGGGGSFYCVDRLRGSTGGTAQTLNTSTANAEGTDSSGNHVLYIAGASNKKQNHVTVIGGYTAENQNPYILEAFRRAPGFFDVVCFRGNASLVIDVPHNLQVKPELMIVKSRNFTSDWLVYSADRTKSQAGFLNTTSAFSPNSAWQSEPTSNTFKFFGVNNDYVAYLFASLPGISKVGSYTGNGGSQTIDCGFGTGSRLVLIKRTDSAGNWIVADSVRGIVAAGDPALYLNSTSAEVTGVDWCDPAPSGFVVIQEPTMNVNVNGAQYAFLAIS